MSSCPSGTHPDRRPSWGISINAPHFHGCFACGFKGVLRGLLIHLGVSVRQAKLLAAEEETTTSTLQLSLERTTTQKTFEHDELFPFYSTVRSDTYFRLLRGLSMKTIRACQLMHDLKDNRVMFPWFLDGQLVGLTGRTLSPKAAREGTKIRSYLEGVSKRDNLYLPQGKITREMLVVVEGEVDALKVYEAGFTNVGAVTGRLSSRQTDLMLNSSAVGVIAFGDDDKTGRLLNRELEAAIGSRKMYKEANYDCVRAEFPKRKLDPGFLPLEAIRKVMKHTRLFPSMSKLLGQEITSTK